jgi:hypothetical protein
MDVGRMQEEPAKGGLIKRIGQKLYEGTTSR